MIASTRFESLSGTCAPRLMALFIAGVLSVTPSISAAVQLAVANPGFEDISGETPVNEFTFGPLSGWELYDPDTITGGGAGPTYFLGTLTPFEPDPIGNPGVYAYFPAGALEGQRVGIAFSSFGSGGQGEWGFVQTLSETLQVNTSYTLEVGIGNIGSGTSMGGQFFLLDGFPGYRVDLLAGGVPVASDNNSLGGTIPDGEFATATINLTTGQTHPQEDETLAVRLVNLNVVDPAFPNSDLEVDFDLVSLVATPVTVPELPALSAPLQLGLGISLAVAGALRLTSRRQ